MHARVPAGRREAAAARIAAATALVVSLVAAPSAALVATPFAAVVASLVAAPSAAVAGATEAPPPAGAPGVAAGDAPSGKSAPSAGAASPNDAPGPGSVPVELPVKSPDGFEFKALYYAPGSASSSAVLLVPDLGQRRDHFIRLARVLQERGYRVLSMDNSGQTRHVVKGGSGAPIFTPMSTKILEKLVPDVTSAVAVLRAQPGVGRVSLVGFGIGANAAILAAGHDASIAAAGLVLPNYGCEEFDPYAAFGDMNARPVLLLETRKKWISDLADAFAKIQAKRPNIPFDHVMLRRDPEALTQKDLEEDYEESVLTWITKSFPPAAH